VRRLGRYIVNALTALSLLLCAATVALWVRSFWVGDGVSWGNVTDGAPPAGRPRHAGRTYVSAARGGLNVFVVRYDAPQLVRATHLPDRPWREWRRTPDPPEYPVYRDTDAFATPPTRYRALGFEAVLNAPHAPFLGRTSRRWSVTVPLYAPAAAFALLPAWRTARVVRRRRRNARATAAATCPTCGYDLRATPDRCPECGAAPPRPAAARSS